MHFQCYVKRFIVSIPVILCSKMSSPPRETGRGVLAHKHILYKTGNSHAKSVTMGDMKGNRVRIHHTIVRELDIPYYCG